MVQAYFTLGLRDSVMKSILSQVRPLNNCLFAALGPGGADVLQWHRTDTTRSGRRTGSTLTSTRRACCRCVL